MSDRCMVTGYTIVKQAQTIYLNILRGMTRGRSDGIFFDDTTEVIDYTITNNSHQLSQNRFITL